jgi:hypothetical protein
MPIKDLVKRLLLVAAAAGLVAASAVPGVAAPVPGTGCTLFPADNAWHADVRSLPVHPRSAPWIRAMGGPDRRLHPDFGPAGAGEQPYGIPYAVVSGSKTKVAVEFQYRSESDAGPYPLGADTPIEGGSDRHALIVDKDACRLYELYGLDWNGGRPTAGSGAIWDLRSNDLRPDTWTSADAAGLPVLAGLLRRDEVVAGEVDHAIRITAARTDRSYLWPARHQAGAASDPDLPPMGARFRLQAGFDISPFRPDTQAVLRAMQRYGVIVADNGSNWYFTGTSEPGWDEDMLSELKSVPAGAFEAVDASSLMVDADSGRVKTGTVPTLPTLPPASTTTTTPTTRPRPTTTTTDKATTTTASTAPASSTSTSTTGAPVTPGPAVEVTPDSSTTTSPPSPSEERAASSREVKRRVILLVLLMLVTAAGAVACGIAAWRRFQFNRAPGQ